MSLSFSSHVLHNPIASILWI